jgi:hypothetical protein
MQFPECGAAKNALVFMLFWGIDIVLQFSASDSTCSHAMLALSGSIQLARNRILLYRWCQEPGWYCAVQNASSKILWLRRALWLLPTNRACASMTNAPLQTLLPKRADCCKYCQRPKQQFEYKGQAFETIQDTCCRLRIQMLGRFLQMNPTRSTTN